MDDTNHNPDDEFTAMQDVYKALAPLKPDAQMRVIAYITSRLEIAQPAVSKRSLTGAIDHDEGDEGHAETGEVGSATYGSFAELHDAAQPNTNARRALVAGYWLQVCQGAESFDGYSANKELKNLGHGINNITNALDALKEQKPALVLQLKKSGKSRQARKTYKVTLAGIKEVEAMIHA